MINTETGSATKKRRTKKILLRVAALILILLTGGGVYLYINLNRLLTNALNKSFSTSIISDVYELKFENLSVNPLGGDVSVHGVEFRQRENSLQNYTYINSSLRLQTRKLVLKNVELLTLIRSNILRLEKIEILEPGIDFRIEDKIPVFFPIKDTVTAAAKPEKDKKRFIEAFSLKEFNLMNASFHTTNLAKEREFNIQNLDLSFANMFINQQPGKDEISYEHIRLSIGEFAGQLQKRSISSVHFNDFEIRIDSFHISQTRDTAIWHFADFSTRVKALDVQTADSLYHLTMQSFGLSYREKSIQLSELSFKPNVSNARLQRDFPYQHTQFSGTVGSLNLQGLNFDSLIFKGKIFIDKIKLDKASVSLYKDKTKPTDKNKFPKYLGQIIRDIKPPLLIGQVEANQVNLVNKERNPDGTTATANINQANAVVKNITNLSTTDMLAIKADAYVENKARFNLELHFSYREPHFSFNGSVHKFNLPDLNPLIEAYTPASVHRGVVDELSFSGNANRTSANGNLKFLYHDLDIDVELEGKAKWKSDVLAFGANAILPSSNPASADLPPRTVKFQVERDLNKSFVNLTIKSLLKGLKETMIMSKENKKAYKEQKKELKKKYKNRDKNEN
jgi:hypothetical protein